MNEAHIVSAVVHARADRVAQIAEHIRTRKLAEVPALDARGRLVVVLEAASAGAVLDTIEELRALPGVIAVNLVYQHTEDAQVLEETLP